MEQWFKKNKSYLIWVLLILFMFKFIQSCNRGTSIDIQKNKMTSIQDSLLLERIEAITKKDYIIDSLENQLLERVLLIKDLNSDLKVAGVKATEAQKRANAVQRTAEKVRSNTTIEIKTMEKDTITQK